MTQPTPQQPNVTAGESIYPMVVHVVSNPMFPPEPELGPNGQPTGRLRKEEPVHWIVSKDHPFVPNFIVHRMFLEDDGVEVYSVSKDNKTGMRDTIPTHDVRLVQESMSMDVFIEELEDADDVGDDPNPGDPDPDPVPEPLPAPTQAPAASGQPS